MRLREVVTTLVRYQSDLTRPVFKVTVELSVFKSLHCDMCRGEAGLIGQISHEARRDVTVAVFGIDGTNINGWRVVRHDDYFVIRFFFRKSLNFSLEPTKLGFVLLHMLLHSPILDVVEIVEAETDKVFLSSCDV